MKQKNKVLKLKNKSGITLIALVITIIVLLILAGISVSMIAGPNGILTQTQNAKIEYSKAQDKEQIELILLGIQEYNNGKKTFKQIYDAFIEDRDKNRTVLEIIEPENNETETDEIIGKTINNYFFIYNVETGKLEILDNLDNCTISYDLNGGNFENDDIQTVFSNIEYGSNHSIISEKPTKENNKFQGWKLKNDEKIYNYGDTIKVKGDMELVAQYSEEKYGIVPIIIEENYDVVSTSSISLNEETELGSLETEIETGPTDDKITYEVRIYKFLNDITIESGNTIELGTSDDVATSSTEAKRMVVAIFEGNLTNNGTITTVASEDGYGGPKGMYICVKGTLINNGTISMTDRGAKATGENVYLYSNNGSNWQYVPADGASGGASVTASGNSNGRGATAGKIGSSGTGRATGGGGSGCATAVSTNSSDVAKSVPGYRGTSYSGGGGGRRCCFILL